MVEGENQSKEGRTMVRLKLTPDVNIVVGENTPRNTVERWIVRLVESQTMSVEEVVKQLAFGGTMSRELAQRITEGAVAAGVLIAVAEAGIQV
jgi:hypothetical protein